MEKTKCKECGLVFEVRIWIRDDGSELPKDEFCQKCRRVRDDRERVVSFKQELEDRREWVRQRWLTACGVEKHFQTKTFENFKRELQPKAFDAVKSQRQRSLVLLSPNVFGLGKTHLVAALVNHLIATSEPARFEEGSCHIITNPCPAHLVDESQMLARIRNTYNRGEREGETEDQVFSAYARFPLLIIDDVGKMKPRDPSFLQNVFYRIISQRYNKEQRIILTTNLSAEELEQHIGGACGDRLKEMCGKGGIIVMNGTSYRKGG